MNSKVLILALLCALLFASSVLAQDDPTAKMSGVADLTPDNFSTVVDGSKHVLVEFMAPWCGWCKRLVPAYKQLGEIVSNSKFASDVVIAKVNADAHSSIGSKYNVRGFPTILLFKKGDTAKPISYEGDRSVEDMIKFINTHAGTSIEKTATADAASQNAEEKTTAAATAAATAEEPKKASNVVVLTPENFDSIVLDTNKHVLVEFYAPWCGHCKRLEPTYEELATKLKDDKDVVIAKIDASTHKDVGSKYGVRGFPTIKLFTKNDKTGNIDFRSQRTVESFEKFIAENKEGKPAAAAAAAAEELKKATATATATATAGAPPATEEAKKASDVVVLTPENFDSIVLDTNKDVLVEFYAPWCGHCKRLEPTYEELATKLKANKDVVIAKIDASTHKDVGSKYEVRGFPTIKLFTKNDKTGSIVFKGQRTVESFEKFIADNKGTKAAAASTTTTTTTTTTTRDEL